MKGLFLSMGSLVVILAVFVIAVRNPYTALIFVFLIGLAGSSMVPGLQTRLMDVAEDAQTLAASLNHAALNIANAFGAWIGGRRHRKPVTGTPRRQRWGSLLAVAGLVVLAVAVILQRRARALTWAPHPRRWNRLRCLPCHKLLTPTFLRPTPSRP